MIITLIILSIGLIVSVIFNFMLSSSKNLSDSLMNEINKENKDIKTENNDLQSTVVQLESKIKSYEETISDYNKENNQAYNLQMSLDELKIQNAGYQTQLTAIQKQNAELSANVGALLADKVEFEKKNAQLIEQNQRKADSYEVILARTVQLNSDNESLKVDIDDYKSQIAQKQIRITELESKISELQRQIGFDCIPEDKPGKESDFPIDTDVTLFKDGKYDSTLKRISNVVVITQYLNDSTHEKAQKYLKLVKSYAGKINELKDDFAILDADEEELSSEYISKFSKIFNEDMAENIIEPVFKAKDDDKFYLELFETIIKYIIDCGIYSKTVTVGNKFEKINFMDVITEDTMNIAQHKIISKILRLPFYARYTSETGKVKEKLLSKGCCVVLKAK